MIDLPFALPTIVAGLTLLALYGPRGSSGINLAYTRAGVLLALLFVTLPFVVRTVQPVLLELDADMEEAAASLGASADGDLPAHRLPEPAAGDPLRRRARVRARGRRVRRGRAHLGEPAVQDGGRVGLHLRAHPVERHRGRGGAVARAARSSPSRCCSPSAPCAAGRRGMIARLSLRVGRARVPGGDPARAGRARLLADVRARRAPAVGRGDDAGRAARVLAHA